MCEVVDNCGDFRICIVTLWKGWKFALSIICSLLFCSKLLILKSNHVRFTLVALEKVATMSKLLSSLFIKEWPWANCSCPSLQKSNRELIALIAPLLFFINSDQSDLLQSLFTKEQLWANRSCRSLQKSYSFMSKSLFRSQKMSNLLEEPKSKCPTLHFGLCTGILRKFEFYGAPYRLHRLQKTFLGGNTILFGNHLFGS